MYGLDMLIIAWRKLNGNLFKWVLSKLFLSEKEDNEIESLKQKEGNEYYSSDKTAKSEPIEDTKGMDMFGRDLELPRFSSGVQRALIQNRSAEVWSEVVDEMLCFYTRHFEGRLNCSLDYSIVGRKMYKAYPNIGRFGSHPWSALMSTLSSRMRTFRHNCKRKQKNADSIKGSDKDGQIFDMTIEGDTKSEVCV